MPNIFNLPSQLPNEEKFETLISSHSVLIERIISTGQTTPTGEWYDQQHTTETCPGTGSKEFEPWA